MRDAIRSADNPLWTARGLVDDGCALVVPVHANDQEFLRLDALVGQDVTVDGFCSPIDPGRLHTGRQIRICDPREIRLAEAKPVADNGSGFDPTRSPGVAEGHYRLQGVRERLRGLHGTLTFESGRERGTKTKVALTLPEAKVLILTTFGAADDLARALSAGACGAVLKSAD